MATYLQGVTDYIPQIQPWAPDFNFYQNVLERSQQKYDMGWERANSIYNSVLNAPMMRGQNNARRDNFFKSIDGQLQQLASIDLSLPQNVAAAGEIFKPFYEDQNIVKDIGFTKQYQDEMQRVEYFRTCVNQEECGDQYWDGGARALQYHAEDFVNASDEDALRMRNPEYVPYANFMEKATKAVKELDMNIEYDSVQGGYNVTTKNGDALVQPLMSFMMSRFGDDPELSRFYGEKAYLMRKENPDQALNIYETSMMQSQAQSEEELQQMIEDRANRQNYEDAKEVIAQAAANEESGFLRAVNSKKIIENQINSGGIVEGGPEDRRYQELLREVDTRKASKEKAAGFLDVVKNKPYVDARGNQVPVGAIDGVVANAMMLREMGAIANTLAYKDYKVSMKADPYALAGYKNQLKQSNMFLQHQYNLTEAAVKDVFKEGKEYRKWLMENDYLDAKTGLPLYVDPDTQKHEIIPGGGMGVYDPADIAAMYRESLLSGKGLPNPGTAISKAGAMNDPYTPGHSSATGHHSDNLDYMSPTQKAYLNYVMEALPGSLQQGTPEETFSGLSPEEQELVTTFVTEGTKADKRVQEVIENKDKTARDIRDVLNDVITDLSSISGGWKSWAAGKQSEMVKERLNILMPLAADGTQQSNPKALQLMASIGNLIAENRADADLPDDFPEFPTNWANVTPADYQELLNVDIDDLIIAAGGTKGLYDLFTNDSKSTVVRGFNTNKMIDRAAVDIIDHDAYSQLANRDHDIAAWKSIDNNVKRGIKYRADDPNLAWYKNNPDGFEPLTDTEKDAIKKYEYYTSQPSFDNGLSDAGLNTSIPELQTANRDQLKTMGLVQWHIDAADKMKENFTRQMNKTFDQFKRTDKDVEEKWYGPKNARSIAQKYIANNIWDPTANDGWGSLGHSDDMFNALMEGGAYTYALFESFGESNLGDFGTPFSWTIPEMEEWAAEGREIFSNKAIFNILRHSELISDMSIPESLDIEGLKAWYSDHGHEQIYEGPVYGGNALFTDPYWQDIDNPEAKWGRSDIVWQLLMSHEDTKVEREGSDVWISNPLFQGTKYKYNLKDIETSRGYEGMLGEAKTALRDMRATFLNEAQTIPGDNAHNYLALPSQFMGDAGGNFAFTSGSLTNGSIVAGHHDQALHEMVPLLNELNGHISDNLDAYGISSASQGDAELLQLLVSTFDPKSPHTWKDSEDKKRPKLNFNVEPVHGHMDLSKVTFEMDPTTKHQWLKEMGYAKYDNDLAKWTYTIDTKGSYYIANSQSDMIKKMRPDPYHLLTGLAVGDAYVDDTFWDEFGGKLEFRRNGQQVEIYQTSRLWSKDKNDYVEWRDQSPTTLPLNGTDWKLAVSKMYDELFQIPFLNAEAMANTRIINDINHYNTNR